MSPRSASDSVILSEARQREVGGSAVWMVAELADLRSFDSAPRDKAVSSYAQDDTSKVTAASIFRFNIADIGMTTAYLKSSAASSPTE